ncbi:myophilin-like [Xenia sp. Carnegie-2017]|uniref:myophilin-like n=1 Tax=Xenia sp. Carnegie-2017 TaxID=2897299 RepID=UPI001F039DD0|nr:myophilin-like [Xenia sp. Carnegie-2017]
MASRPKGFGMTAELAAKKDAKFNPALEREALDFIESKTGRKCDGATQAALKDGVLLCHLANAIRPGAVKKINESKMAFKMMENIGNFLTFAESLGCAKSDLFQTVDLYEGQNIPQVINGILAIKRKLSGGESTPNVRNFSEEQLKAGRNVIGLQMGTNKGASQAGMSAPGAVRQIRHEDNMDRSAK